MHAGQETAAPDTLTGRGRVAGHQYDKGGQVVVLRPQPIRDPRSHRRTTEKGAARIQKELRGGVVELIGVERADDGDFIHEFGKMWKQLGYPGAALAVLLERIRRPEYFRVPLDEGEALTLVQLVGTGLTVEPVQQGLVIEQVLLRRGTRHVQVDDALGLGREMRDRRVGLGLRLAAGAGE